MLHVLGLSHVEQDLYTTLVAGPPVTHSEFDALATEHGWPDRGRTALSRLLELGLVTELSGSAPNDPPRLACVAPELALDSLLAARDRDLLRARRQLLRLSTRFRHRTESREEPPLVEVVRGSAATTRLLDELNRNTSSEILGFDAPPYFGDVSVGNVIRVDQRLALDLWCRILYDPRSLVPGRAAQLARTDRAAIHQSRVADLPLKLFLFDGQVAIMPLDHTQTSVVATLVVRDPHLLAVLRALFEVYWEHAVPNNISSEQAGGAPTAQPPDEDRVLLSLLTSGFTDQAIAAQLGWSDRTVRRKVRSLSRLLDAQNRFQAGYQAVVRGWLSLHVTDAHSTHSTHSAERGQKVQP